MKVVLLLCCFSSCDDAILLALALGCHDPEDDFASIKFCVFKQLLPV